MSEVRMPSLEILLAVVAVLAMPSTFVENMNILLLVSDFAEDVALLIEACCSAAAAN